MSSFTPIPEAPDAVRGRPIAWALAGTIAAILACAGLVAAMRASGGGASAIDPGPGPRAVPFTMIDEAGPTDPIDRWSWADRAHTIVRVPASVAIDRYLARKP
ncbi:MAG TPA: hypothetical protein VL463_21460 [Kofleriaceae bacterium]|nr:hypothetical protein [Kofleriaceae bacterium]